ncbi:MAG TPA: hypothetical protein VLC98_12710 [Phnomibacter sp.]|nr:hypothetical protein [Phnomibacter sp.]
MPYISFKPLIFLLPSWLLLSCSKMQEGIPAPPAITMATAGAALQNNMQRTGINLSFSSISQVQTLQADGHSYSLIRYTDESGNGKVVVIETYYDSEGNEVQRIYRCESSFCDCMIEMTANPDGTINLRCTCYPCTMFIS